MPQKKEHVVRGVVADESTGEGVPDLRIEAWDEEGLADEPLGRATTDKKGAFRLQFEPRRLREIYGERGPTVHFLVFTEDEELLRTTRRDVEWRIDLGDFEFELPVPLPPSGKTVRHIYLKIERIDDYNPVRPTEHVPAGVAYKRDCMRNEGHPEGIIPDAEVDARAVPAVVYREYLDPDYLVPKTDKLVPADINEPAYHHRVPGTVIWAHPDEILKIHVLNCDNAPHSLHLHGLEYGIDSDGAWPFGLESSDGRRSDEICPGQTWTYTFCVTEESIGVWPFHDHAQRPGMAIDQGLFGGIIVLPKKKPKPPFERFRPIEDLKRQIEELGVPPARMTPLQRRHVDHRLEWIKEKLQTELPRPLLPRRARVLHVPLFFHVMRHPRPRPLFDTGDIEELGGTASLVFDDEGVFEYFCAYHPSMTGTIRVEPGGPAAATVTIEDAPDMGFYPDEQTVAPGGTVEWINNSEFHHTATSKQGTAMPTHCFNGRGFVGNAPTIVGRPGQKIRWYVFNLDLGHEWHNFHPHAQRWRLGSENIDVRSIGPAESFMVETDVPSVLLLTEEMEEIQDPDHRPDDAELYRLKGDFLFHCHVHHHMRHGMVALVRSKQSVWLTPAMAEELETTVGLALDDTGNACPDVDVHRCAKMGIGRLEEIPGDPEVIMMHAALLPNTDKVLFWGKTRADQTRLYDHQTDAYSAPANQPASLPGETPSSSDLWSAAHAFLDTPEGTLLAHGGFTEDGGGYPNKSYLFDPDPGVNSWSPAGDTAHGRFYASTITLADGKLLTLFGNGGPPAVSNTIEVYDPAADSWSAPKALPPAFDYFFYPWTYLLPDGELFVAGPQVPARKFDWTADPVVDDPTKQWDTLKGGRGSNMTGSSVLLTLRPPDYDPVVFIMGGSPLPVRKSVQHIDLSAAAPSWTDGPDMHEERVQCTAVLLPDGRILVGGGIIGIPGGGPLEILDPRNLADGWKLAPESAYPRLYHSSMILLPDGSVFIGGDDDGADPCERYFPEYHDLPRPTISNAPASVNYGSGFTVESPEAPSVAEVVLLRPGAVTHGFDMSQRAVELVITGGDASSVDVEAPPDGNVAPPGHYLLFVLDGSRIPSTGRWIRLTP